MATMFRVVVAAMLLVGCVVPASHTCTDGRVCGAGTVCDVTHHLCVSQDQLDQCKTADDRTPCTSDVTVGLCDQGVCLPACGDSGKQATEECDDGNFINHDGCSSTCSVETGAWSRVTDPWSERFGHTMTYDAERNVLVLFGGVTSGDGTDSKVSAETWEYANGSWSRIAGAAPPARRFGVMAYDSDRHVSVLFGGSDESSSFLRDTWEYDGTWRQVVPTTSPPARMFAAMGYDATTQRIVLHGGVGTDATLGDLWEYDGATWSPMTTTGTGPGPQFAHVMAFDTARDHMVVFAANKTWELASGAWSEQVGTQATGRRYGSMTYVPDRQVIVMTGGRDLGAGRFLNDTWEYTTAWTRVPTPTAPDAVYAAALAGYESTAILVGGILQDGSGTRAISHYSAEATGLTWRPLDSGLIPTRRTYSPLVYDPLRHEIVTYSDGQYNPSPITNDTYTFDGSAWHRRAPGPPPRSGHAMTFDPARGQVVMVGGDPAGTPVDDTWTWNGATWSLLVPTGTKPPARVLAALAADPGLGRVVLFGGKAGYDDTDLSDTWELEGSTWTQVTTQNHPAGGRSAMAYDPDAGHIILFDTSGATWMYVDRDWSPIMASPSPPARVGAVFVHDASRHRMVLYGGSNAFDLTERYNDMWELDGTTWTPISYDLAPQPADAPGGAYMPETRALVLFGGGIPNASQEMWQFRYSSQDPDELCDSLNIDEDLDGLVDCADPDCVCN